MKPFVIEQTSEEAKLAFEIHQNVFISQIRLSGAKLSATPLIENSGPVTIGLKFKSRSAKLTPEMLSVEISFQMRGSDEEGSGQEPSGTSPTASGIAIDCLYEMNYALRPGFEPRPDQIRAFQNGNAIFNAWPYFREFLQSTMARMGYPPYAAPFLVLRLKPHQQKESAAAAKLPLQATPVPSKKKTNRQIISRP